MTGSAGRRFAILVAGALLLHVALLAWAGPGFNASDDEAYARAAHQILSGTYEPMAEHRWNRFGVIVPAAASYGLFGVNAWSTILPSLAWSLAGIVGAALVGRRLGGDAAGALAAFVAAPLTMMVNASAFLMPDNPVGVQMFIASACLWMGRDDDVRRPGAWGLCAALAVTVGVLTKLTALWLAPLFGVLFVRDLVRRRHLRFWAVFATAGVVAGALFFVAYGITTGDPLYRMHAIDERHTATHWGYGDDDAATLLWRITGEPVVLLFDRLPELALVLAAAVALIRDGDRPSAGVRFWAAHAIVVAAGFWFGSTSLSEYSPLPPLPRMLTPLVPPLAALAGLAITGRKTPAPLPWGTIACVAVGAVTGVAVGRPMAGVAIAAGGVALAPALLPRGIAVRLPPVVRVAGLPIVLLAMCSYGVARDGVGENGDMRRERRLAGELGERLGEGALLVIDRRSERTLEHYQGYAPPEGAPELWDWSRREPGDAPTTEPVFAYVHARRIAAKKGRYAPPAWLAERIDAGEIVFEKGVVTIRRLAPSR